MAKVVVDQVVRKRGNDISNEWREKQQGHNDVRDVVVGFYLGNPISEAAYKRSCGMPPYLHMGLRPVVNGVELGDNAPDEIFGRDIPLLPHHSSP